MNAFTTAPAKLLMAQVREIFHESLCNADGYRFSADATAHGLDYHCTVYFNTIEDYLSRIQAVDAQAHEEVSVELITLYDLNTNLEIDINNYHEAKVIVDAIHSGSTQEQIIQWALLIKDSEVHLNWDTVIEWANTHFECDVESNADYAQEQYKESNPEIFKTELIHFVDWDKVGQRMLHDFGGEVINGKLYNHD